MIQGACFSAASILLEAASCSLANGVTTLAFFGGVGFSTGVFAGGVSSSSPASGSRPFGPSGGGYGDS